MGRERKDGLTDNEGAPAAGSYSAAAVSCTTRMALGTNRAKSAKLPSPHLSGLSLRLQGYMCSFHALQGCYHEWDELSVIQPHAPHLRWQPHLRLMQETSHT